MKYFYVIYIHNEKLKTVIDGIRLFADTTQKYSAHITVRGPYESKVENYTPEKLNEWQKDIHNTHIMVNGIDTFFNVNQSTVYFKCVSDELKEMWWKKDFNHFSPHMTIYDKSDKEFANEILGDLEKYTFNFTFKVYALEKLISDSKRYPKIQGKIFHPLINAIDYKILSNCLNETIDKNFIENASKKKRIEYINKLSNILSSIKSDENLL